MIFPTAHEISIAVVTAARLHGEDPIASVQGAEGMRGRWLATAALLEAFPGTPHPWIAQSCGVSGRSRCENSRAELRMKRFHERYRAKWWSDADFEAVKAALAEAIAETDAELRNRAGVIDLASCEPRLPGAEGDQIPEPTSSFSPSFEDEKRDTLDDEAPDFSHLRDASDRTMSVRTIEAPKPVSAAARVLADFQRSRIIKTARGRVIDHRQVGIVDMGDPGPGRSALDQRGTP